MRSRISKLPSVAHGDLVHALKLVRDAQPLADHLQRGAGAARGRFPAAEQQQPRAVQAGDGLDGAASAAAVSNESVKPRGRPIQRHQFERRLLRHGHHHLLQLGLGPQAHQPDLAAGHAAGARCAASYSACAGPGSSTAGSIISFFSAGPPGRSPAPASATGRARCFRRPRFEKVHVNFS